MNESKDNNETVNTIDFLDLDEEVIDKKIDLLLKKTDISANEIKILTNLVKYKHMICLQEESDCENDSIVNFAVLQLMEIKENTNDKFDDLLKLLSLSLELNKENILSVTEHIFQQTLCQLTLNQKSFSNDDVKNNILYLKMIDCLCKVFMKNKLKPNNIFIKDEVMSLINCQEKTINLYLYSNTIPNIIECFEEYELLNTIYDNIINGNKIEFNDVLILSTLSNFYFPIDKYKSMVKSYIVKDVKFWKLIQNGLFGIDDSVRKCCNFLLKRTIDFVMNSDINIRANDNNESVPYFQYKKDDKVAFNNVWHNLFVIIESIEEKQFHLVDCALNLLPNITILHPSWYHFILKRTLVHESNNVIRKSLSIALKYDNKNNIFPYEQLLSALNKIFLYENFFNNENVLISMFNEFLIKEQNFDYLNKNLKINPLSPIPRFFISYMIMNNNNNVKFNINGLLEAFFGENGYKYNNWYIENGTQCCLLNFIINNMTIDNIEDLLLIYSKFNKKVLYRHGKLWVNMTKSIKIDLDFQSIATELVFNMNEKYVSHPTTIVKLIIMLIDASLITNDHFIKLFNDKIAGLKDCDKRIYTNSNEFDPIFNFITNCITVITNHEDDLHKTFMDNLRNHYESILSYLIMRLNNISHDEYDLMCEIVLGLNTILNDNSIALDFYLKLNPIIGIIKTFINLNDKDSITKCFATKILSEITLFVYRSKEFDSESKINIINSHYDCIKEHLFLSNNEEVCRLKGNIMSCYNENISIILYHYYIMRDELNLNEILSLNMHVIDLLEKGGCLLWTIKLIQIVIPKLMVAEELDHIKVLLNRSWKEILQIKKNDQFRKCIKNYMKAVFNQNLLNNIAMSDIVKDCGKKVMELGETAPFAIYLMMTQVKSVYKSCNMKLFIDILFEALIFGNVFRKDQRIEADICEYIECNKDIFSTYDLMNSDLNPLNQIRAIALEIYINQDYDFHILMLNLMKNRIDSICKPKQRYHANSLNHRVLLRLFQVIILSCRLTQFKKDPNEMIVWCLNLLTNQPHHHSIKMMLEWLIVLHLSDSLHKMSLKESLENFQMELLPQTSYFMIIYLLIKHQIMFKSCDYIENNFDYSINTLLPFTMGQLFNIRLNSQYLIMKLLKFIDNNECKNKYELVNNIIESNFKMCAEEKNLKKIQDDFYINNFDVIENLNIESIFYNIPRLTGVVKDEWIQKTQAEYLDKLCTISKSQQFDLSHINKTVFYPNESAIISDVDNAKGSIQKKFVPWKNMLTDIGINANETEKNVEKCNLIVVASLIDRIPNLGGLCRTCEVFGVKKYVINSLKHVQDKQFQNLSVSSERWVDISEVQPGQDLKQYLMDMKMKGYSIVGAEQSSSSVLLNDFSFPSNTLLVLGHEKEGISPDLLSMLDYCVEIPQQGFVRSLNVHVTASIFIWEYARQHIK